MLQVSQLSRNLSVAKRIVVFRDAGFQIKPQFDAGWLQSIE
jgi:hypothetical protein